MPRYFFHVIDGVTCTDLEGVEIGSLAEARREAVRLSGEILSEHPGDFWTDEQWRMDVADESGLTLFALHFSAVDAPAAKHGPEHAPERGPEHAPEHGPERGSD
jgi:hypothetical protein